MRHGARVGSWIQIACNAILNYFAVYCHGPKSMMAKTFQHPFPPICLFDHTRPGRLPSLDLSVWAPIVLARAQLVHDEAAVETHRYGRGQCKEIGYHQSASQDLQGGLVDRAALTIGGLRLASGKPRLRASIPFSLCEGISARLCSGLQFGCSNLERRPTCTAVCTPLSFEYRPFPIDPWSIHPCHYRYVVVLVYR
ncbi:hypothetical protein PYCCODRAFT_76186 [Trametes coccinea BRFM310]|uniref:Uncharacterized protein n=1 Tax=Trametes coccinea (strain BRFM310) TaxID=1353009 RepID=A0A1Y2IUK2_TRAC3|nr:hypothetical protein PYCCODRAFT_76186 [Trametes coccinea BRFM310]